MKRLLEGILLKSIETELNVDEASKRCSISLLKVISINNNVVIYRKTAKFKR